MKPNKPAPARSPRQGQGRPICRGGIPGSWVPPPKVPRRVFSRRGGGAPPTGPRQHPAAGTHRHPRAHTPTIARARTTPPPPSAQKKKLFKLSARPPPLINSAPAPRTDFPERLFRPRGLGLGPRLLGSGRGAPEERGAYLPGLTLGLTARGWKAPRGLTSDPLSPACRLSTLALPHPPGARKQTSCERRERRPPRAGRADGREGLGPAHRARRGRGRGHLLPAPPPLRNAAWPRRRSGGNPGWDGALGSRKWPEAPFGEHFRGAYCVLQVVGAGGALLGGEIMSIPTFVILPSVGSSRRQFGYSHCTEGKLRPS